MKSGSATRKIPGGKLIRVDAQYAERLERVKITGDFFLHPEETLDRIEARLAGAALPLDRAGLALSIAACLQENQAELIGITPDDIVTTLAEALA
jgi:lipoate-protein ligase A